MTDDRPTLMMTTPGITEPNLTKHPLGTEGELTPGPDEVNPYRSPEEREEVERIERKQRERRDNKLFKSMEGTKDRNDNVADPTAGDDPFVFDDVTPGFDLPWLTDGPKF